MMRCIIAFAAVTGRGGRPLIGHLATPSPLPRTQRWHCSDLINTARTHPRMPMACQVLHKEHSTYLTTATRLNNAVPSVAPLSTAMSDKPRIAQERRQGNQQKHTNTHKHTHTHTHTYIHTYIHHTYIHTTGVIRRQPMCSSAAPGTSNHVRVSGWVGSSNKPV